MTWRDKFVGWFWGEDEQTPHQLFAGVEKPTTTLAKMIAAEVLKIGDGFDTASKTFTHSRFVLHWTTGPIPTLADCEAARIKHGYSGIWKQDFKKGGSYYYKTEAYVRDRLKEKAPVVVNDCIVTGLACTFDGKEKQIIIAGIEKALVLDKAYKANKAAHDNQQKAVDALANWMGVSGTEQEQALACGAKKEKECGTNANTKTMKKRRSVAASSDCNCSGKDWHGRRHCLCPVSVSV